MSKENAILKDDKVFDDFDNLEEELQNQIDEELSEMKFLLDERNKIGSQEELGNVIQDVVWEQFMNQIAVTAGNDFIEANNGLNLDLRKEAHIQTTENFANGKIASHNTKIDYQKRYDDWQSNFVKDKNGNVVTHKTRSGKEEATLVKGARKPFDEGRPSGSAEKHTDMDHTVSAAEIIRDPAANAHMTKEEQIAFANSEKNLNEMDSSLNRSKGDKSMDDWLDNPNSKGQKPDEIYNLSEDDKKKLRKKDKEAREEYERKKKKAEQRSIEAGKQSRKEEAFRIGGKALRAVVMQLLAELVKEMISKLILWFKSANKSLKTLVDNLKDAIHEFIGKLKTHIVNASNTLVTTIATAIIGPVVGTIKKAWTMIKQGWSSLKEAIKYIKDPSNKNKPFGILMMEVGKIVIAGLTGVGALALGDVIEKGLMTIPIFGVEIPLLGSLASILGVFLGAVASGIIGAIALNKIDEFIANKLKRENDIQRIHKGNEVLEKQQIQSIVIDVKNENKQMEMNDKIRENHEFYNEYMKESIDNILNVEDEDIEFKDDRDEQSHLDDFDAQDDILNDLLNGD